MNRLEANGLTVRYGTGRKAMTAVDGVDIAIPNGKTLGLVGESGCGKSTIAKALIGLLPIAGGTIRLDGTDVTSTAARNRRSYRRQVQIVFQDPFSSLNPRLTVYEQVRDALALRNDISQQNRRTEAKRLLDLVGLGESSLEGYPHQFSGGQRQRIAIARALAVNPRILILDEVTSALDVSVQATILNLLRDLQSELGLSYLFISHDLSVVRAMSDNVTVLYLARIAESAPTDPIFDAPRHPYTRSLIASIPKLGERGVSAPLSGDLPDPQNAPSGCRFRTRCPIGPKTFPDRTLCIEKDPALTEITTGHRVACHFSK